MILKLANVKILSLYISAGHNFFGHYEKPPGKHEIRSMQEAECVAGEGIRGDRFYQFKPNYKGQITFFSYEVYEELCKKLKITDKPTSVFRRNVITKGIDLNTLVGKQFSIQGVQFEGTGECHPCHWMNSAFGPGAEEFLQGRGGLRARILTSGLLKIEN